MPKLNVFVLITILVLLLNFFCGLNVFAQDYNAQISTIKKYAQYIERTVQEAKVAKDNFTQNPSKANQEKFNKLNKQIKDMRESLLKMKQSVKDSQQANSLWNQVTKSLNDTYFEPVWEEISDVSVWLFSASQDELFGQNWKTINSQYAAVKRKQQEIIKRKQELLKKPNNKKEIEQLNTEIKELKEKYDILRKMIRVEQQNLPYLTELWGEDNFGRYIDAIVSNFDTAGIISNAIFLNIKAIYDTIKPALFVTLGNKYLKPNGNLTKRIVDSVVLSVLTAGPGDIPTVAENTADKTVGGVSSGLSDFIYQKAEKMRDIATEQVKKDMDNIAYEEIKKIIKSMPYEDLPKTETNTFSKMFNAMLNRKDVRDKLIKETQDKYSKVANNLSKKIAQKSADSASREVAKGLSHAPNIGIIVDFSQDLLLFLSSYPDLFNALDNADILAKKIREDYRAKVQKGEIDKYELSEDACVERVWFHQGVCGGKKKPETPPEQKKPDDDQKNKNKDSNKNQDKKDKTKQTENKKPANTDNNDNRITKEPDKTTTNNTTGSSNPCDLYKKLKALEQKLINQEAQNEKVLEQARDEKALVQNTLSKALDTKVGKTSLRYMIPDNMPEPHKTKIKGLYKKLNDLSDCVNKIAFKKDSIWLKITRTKTRAIDYINVLKGCDPYISTPVNVKKEILDGAEKLLNDTNANFNEFVLVNNCSQGNSTAKPTEDKKTDSTTTQKVTKDPCDLYKKLDQLKDKANEIQKINDDVMDKINEKEKSTFEKIQKLHQVKVKNVYLKDMNESSYPEPHKSKNELLKKQLEQIRECIKNSLSGQKLGFDHKLKGIIVVSNNYQSKLNPCGTFLSRYKDPGSAEEFLQKIESFINESNNNLDKYTLKNTCKIDETSIEDIASGTIVSLNTKEIFGTSKKISLNLNTDSPSSDIKILWESSPNLTFKPKESSGLSTTVTFDRMSNPTRIWAEIMKNGKKIGESEQVELEVVSPDFKFEYTPPSNKAKLNQPIKVIIKSTPVIDENLIDYRWVEPVDRKELEKGTIEIIPKDTKPIKLHVIARVPAVGDNVNENIKDQFAASSLKVKAVVLGPKYDKVSSSLDPKKASKIIIHQDVEVKVIVEDADKDKITYKWSVNEDSHITAGYRSEVVTVNRSQPGICNVKVVVSDKSGIKLGEASTSFNVLNDEKPKKAKEKLEEAKKSYNSGDIDSAISSAQEGEKLDPKNSEISSFLKKLQSEKDQYLSIANKAKELANSGDLNAAQNQFAYIPSNFQNYPPIKEVLNFIKQKKQDKNLLSNKLSKDINESIGLSGQCKYDEAIKMIQNVMQQDPYKGTSKQLSTAKNWFDQFVKNKATMEDLIQKTKYAISQNDTKMAYQYAYSANSINPNCPGVKELLAQAEKMRNQTPTLAANSIVPIVPNAAIPQVSPQMGPVYSNNPSQVPVYSATANQTAVYNNSLPQVPLYTPPVNQVPVFNAPAQQASTYSAPVYQNSQQATGNNINNLFDSVISEVQTNKSTYNQRRNGNNRSHQINNNQHGTQITYDTGDTAVTSSNGSSSSMADRLKNLSARTQNTSNPIKSGNRGPCSTPCNKNSSISSSSNHGGNYSGPVNGPDEFKGNIKFSISGNTVQGSIHGGGDGAYITLEWKGSIDSSGRINGTILSKQLTFQNFSVVLRGNLTGNLRGNSGSGSFTFNSDKGSLGSGQWSASK